VLASIFFLRGLRIQLKKYRGFNATDTSHSSPQKQIREIEENNDYWLGQLLLRDQEKFSSFVFSNLNMKWWKVSSSLKITLDQVLTTDYDHSELPLAYHGLSVNPFDGKTKKSHKW